MLYTQSCLGVRKHRQAGTGGKHKIHNGSRVSIRTVNAIDAEREALRRRHRSEMFGSIQELMRTAAG